MVEMALAAAEAAPGALLPLVSIRWEVEEEEDRQRERSPIGGTYEEVAALETFLPLFLPNSLRNASYSESITAGSEVCLILKATPGRFCLQSVAEMTSGFIQATIFNHDEVSTY